MPCPLGEMESRRIYGLERVSLVKEAFKQLRIALGHESSCFKDFILRLMTSQDAFDTNYL